MAYNNYQNTPETSKDLLWDLRQIYAQDIIGVTLKQIKMARDTSDFPKWFKLLRRDLRVEINHKMDKKERLRIRERIEKINYLISKNEDVFLGRKVDNPQGYLMIDNALCSLEMLMWNVMEKHNMLGKPEGDEGLF